MSKSTLALLTLLGTTGLAVALARGQTQSGSPVDPNVAAPDRTTRPTEELLATVNGTAIRDADVRFVASSGGHDEALSSEQRRNVLDALVRKELIRQRAVELGLDANAKYQEKLAHMEARINAFKRDELAKLFQKDISARAEVSEADAKQYFDRNAARIRTELHVWQLLWRDEASTTKALNDLRQGASFEEIAARRFPKVPKTGRAPWDLGYLRWRHVPEAWRDVVYDLKVGEVSDVIRGPNNRFWIIKLVDRRRNPDISFDSIKPTVMDVLKAEKIEALRQKADLELRARASIVYSENRVGASDD